MIGRSMGISRTMKNIGSQATQAASRKADDIAIGARSSRSVMHPGSSAGLKNQSIVRLEANGTGYANPSNQIARNASPKTRDLPAIKSSLPTSRTGSTFDSRLTCSPSSSISRLSKLKK